MWSEIPVYWTIRWERSRTFEVAAAQLEEMIERDRNRAAVILWSVGNETPRSPERLDSMRRLVERARELDPTRLVTAALEPRYVGETTLMIDDPLGAHLDVLGCNEYVGWYDGPVRGESGGQPPRRAATSSPTATTWRSPSTARASGT